MNKLFKAALTSAMSALPGSINPGNQYARSYAAALTLGVSADFEFDTQEFTQACIFLEQDETLRSEDLTSRGIEFFRSYTKAIEKVMHDESLEFTLVQSEMIAEVRECPDQYKPALRAMINQLISISNATEKAVLQRIAL